jgi:2-keto-4-pentenoate hydratase/2-oxohepta-3-ene-1,7-dioic acid hydratase in catechol pathway
LSKCRGAGAGDLPSPVVVAFVLIRTPEHALKLATYTHRGVRHAGLVSADGSTVTAFDLPGDEARRGALALIERVAARKGLPATAGAALKLADVTLEAPIPLPRRNLFCVGRNYHAHAKELSGSVFKGNTADPAAWPIVFSKVPETVVGPRADVVLPGDEVSAQIDYEAELAIVIGTGGRNIARATAMEHVFGYTIVNDVTARDVQMRHQQWDLGKSFDTFCPMGPWIVTADELDGRATRVRCWVGGELRQDARTEDLIFDIPTLVETCSRGITLYPGDVIASGTPSGVGMGMSPPRWLKHGDTVRIAIDGLGEIENRFVGR